MTALTGQRCAQCSLPLDDEIHSRTRGTLLRRQGIEESMHAFVAPPVAPAEPRADNFASFPRYTATVGWSAEDGEFVATCAQWPGLSGCDANPATAITVLYEAIGMAVEVQTEDGDPIPAAAPLQETTTPAPSLVVGDWQVVETIGGTIRIDDNSEDCPIATFHQGTEEARRNANLLMRALAEVTELRATLATQARTLGAAKAWKESRDRLDAVAGSVGQDYDQAYIAEQEAADQLRAALTTEPTP